MPKEKRTHGGTSPNHQTTVKWMKHGYGESYQATLPLPGGGYTVLQVNQTLGNRQWIASRDGLPVGQPTSSPANAISYVMGPLQKEAEMFSANVANLSNL